MALTENLWSTQGNSNHVGNDGEIFPMPCDVVNFLSKYNQFYLNLFCVHSNKPVVVVGFEKYPH